MRPRIEHGGDVEDVDRIRRLAQLGIIPVITPPQQRAMQPRNFSRTTPRYRTLVNENVMPAACSDATGTIPIFSPLGAIAALVTPEQDGGGAPPGEELTFEEALTCTPYGLQEVVSKTMTAGPLKSVNLAILQCFLIITAECGALNFSI